MEVPHLPGKFEKLLPEGTVRRMVEIDGYHIHYLIRGKGIPVFMMHGNPTWSFLYRNIMGLLDPEIYQCIVPDLLGLGLSDKPKDKAVHTLEHHARIMSGFLESQLSDDFIFVGQDWGGAIGLLASIESQYRLRGMVLMNTTVRPPRQGFRSTSFHKFSRLPILSDLAFRVFGFPQIILHRVQGNPHSIAGLIKQAYKWPLKRFSTNMAPLMLARMVPDSHTHASVPLLEKTQRYAAEFKGPVELIWGKKDPILGSLHKAHKKLIPHAEVTLTDGGHFLQEEYPGEIADAIIRVAESSGNIRQPMKSE